MPSNVQTVQVRDKELTTLFCTHNFPFSLEHCGRLIDFKMYVFSLFSLLICLARILAYSCPKTEQKHG